MGGYAGFVWPAYGVTAIVLGGLALYSWRRHQHSGADVSPACHAGRKSAE